VGDKYTVSQIAYTNIGRVGENVLWNMSGISVGDDSHNVRYIALRDTAQHKYAMIGNKAMRIFQKCMYMWILKKYKYENFKKNKIRF
jgi:hypothetical protein